ncbi:hypothetical protein [Paraburkholderia sp. J41]|uniref:hypothetical protein n=1 Tax=Paraburkholderia sp. J41 TaxID=2805433 RepID=UPI002AC3114C|nr:hypothetical protein [Paraburkholderia sp. J41]
MKNAETVRERAAMAASALALGMVSATAGAALWLRALEESAPASAGDEAASVTAVLIGVFLATCGGQALWRTTLR